MKFLLFPLLALAVLSGCNKSTSPKYIQKNCCNKSETQYVFVESTQDTGSNRSYFFLPQVFNPGAEDPNKTFTSTEQGVASYDITIKLANEEDVIWLYEGAAPINWDGTIANSGLPAQSGVYTYKLTATFANGEVVTVNDQSFCLLREFAACPDNISDCVLRSMFDINDTTGPVQYINEDALLTTRLYDKCVNP